MLPAPNIEASLTALLLGNDNQPVAAADGLWVSLWVWCRWGAVCRLGDTSAMAITGRENNLGSYDRRASVCDLRSIPCQLAKARGSPPAQEAAR